MSYLHSVLLVVVVVFYFATYSFYGNVFSHSSSSNHFNKNSV